MVSYVLSTQPSARREHKAHGKHHCFVDKIPIRLLDLLVWS